ncbi:MULTISPECIES: acyl-CoA dehydrogenase [Pseudomonas]|nr:MULTISPECIES: acyl-CoA dehydrogenase [Pseudomonas]
MTTVAASGDMDIHQQLRSLIEAGKDRLPLPGAGHTLTRWQALAEVASWDLSLVKLFEGHTDALAILAELAPAYEPGNALWGVWAAELPDARVVAEPLDSGKLRLNGIKGWCSGAACVDRALITVTTAQGAPFLAAVTLSQPTVTLQEGHWAAVGMAATQSFNVCFDGTLADVVCAGDGYWARPGFWQGGAGIAACWYGAAARLAKYLRLSTKDDPHTLAHLGAVDSGLKGAATSLRECARWIDDHPAADASLPVRRVRAQVEAAVESIVRHVGRALGATPYCRDRHFARLVADLPVFVRQSHAERDLAALGALVREQAQAGDWRL